MLEWTVRLLEMHAFALKESDFLQHNQAGSQGSTLRHPLSIPFLNHALDQIVFGHGLQFHFFGDDIKIYISIKSLSKLSQQSAKLLKHNSSRNEPP